MSKVILYHVTPKENVPSILKKGLLRGGNGKGNFVSLSESPKSWITDGLALLQVDITGILCDVRTWLPDLDEICVWGDIEPKRVKVIKGYGIKKNKRVKRVRALADT